MSAPSNVDPEFAHDSPPIYVPQQQSSFANSKGPSGPPPFAGAPGEAGPSPLHTADFPQPSPGLPGVGYAPPIANDVPSSEIMSMSPMMSGPIQVSAPHIPSATIPQLSESLRSLTGYCPHMKPLSQCYFKIPKPSRLRKVVKKHFSKHPTEPNTVLYRPDESIRLCSFVTSIIGAPVTLVSVITAIVFVTCFGTGIGATVTVRYFFLIAGIVLFFFCFFCCTLSLTSVVMGLRSRETEVRLGNSTNDAQHQQQRPTLTIRKRFFACGAAKVWHTMQLNQIVDIDVQTVTTESTDEDGNTTTSTSYYPRLWYRKNPANAVEKENVRLCRGGYGSHKDATAVMVQLRSLLRTGAFECMEPGDPMGNVWQ